MSHCDPAINMSPTIIPNPNKLLRGNALSTASSKLVNLSEKLGAISSGSGMNGNRSEMTLFATADRVND